MMVHVSNDVKDIIEVSRQSAHAKDGIRIMELSSLGDLIPKQEAEAIRKELLRRHVQTKQLTNQRVFEPWTAVKGFVEQCMQVRYVSKDVLPIGSEVLLFDDTVAIYRVEPEVSVTIICEPAFAA